MQKFTYPLENKTRRSSTRKLFLVIRCLRGKKRRKITVNINDEKTIAEKHEYQNNWNNNRVKFDKRGKKFWKIFDRNYTVTKPRGEKMAKKTKYKMKKLRRKKTARKNDSSYIYTKRKYQTLVATFFHYFFFFCSSFVFLVFHFAILHLTLPTVSSFFYF